MASARRGWDATAIPFPSGFDGNSAMTSCLLVIDVQWGMFQALKVPKVWNDGPLLARILTLIQKARAAGTRVVYVQHAGEPHESLAAGSPAFALHPAFAPQPDEPVVVKRRPNAFLDTPLHGLLRGWGIKEIVACGIQTEVCVDSTCRAAADLGYEVTLVSDAHSTWDNQILKAEQVIAHHNVTLKDYDFVRLLKTDELKLGEVPDGGCRNTSTKVNG